MNNYYNQNKWKQFLKESNCGSSKREEDDESSLEEDCWDGYERNPDVPEGEQGSCVKKTNEAANNQMNLQSRAKGKAMGLLQTAKAMAQAPSHEPARGYAAAVAKAAGEIVDLMVELEGFQAASSGQLDERDAGMEVWMEKFKLHMRLPQNQPMDEFMKDNAMYAYRQGMDPKQAAEELRAASAERDFPESGMELYDIDEAQEDVKEGEICDAGIQYVLRTDPGGKDIHRGDEDTDGDGEKEIKNWSARAAQIASKKCKDPSYGTGKSKKKNEAAGITPEQFAKEHGVSVGKDGNIIVSPDQPLSLKAAEQVQEAGWSVDMKGKFLIISPKPLNEGGLSDWEKENWTHSDGTPCGGGDKDGSQSRCKPASKWKGMSKGEKSADNAKKKAGTKAGKQYVSATKKGKVTKAHTK